MISVASCAHNEEENLPKFLERTTQTLQEYGEDWEIIIVDDGSTDNTWKILSEQKNPKIKGIRLSKNFGHQRALACAMQHCQGDIICSIDSDLQDPPELIPAMLEKMKETGAEIVYGKRKRRKNTNPLLNLAYKIFYKILRALSGTPIPENTGDFRIAKIRAVKTVLAMQESHDFLRGAFAWIGFHQEEFLYIREGRTAGKSSYSLKKLTELAINGIWGFSMKPLRIAITLSFTLASFATLLGIYILIGYIKGNETPPGWVSICCIILITGSAHLLALGAIAEYIGQILKITRNRPGTIIQEKSWEK